MDTWVQGSAERRGVGHLPLSAPQPHGQTGKPEEGAKVLGSLIGPVASDKYPPLSGPPYCGQDSGWSLSCTVLGAFRVQSWVYPDREGSGHTRGNLVKVHLDGPLYAVCASTAER